MDSRKPGAELALNLRLLDHQIMGPEGELLGNVDNLLMEEVDGHWFVASLMTGPAAAAQRQGGRMGRWVEAIWRRMHPDADPVPVAVPLRHVTKVDSAVHVDESAARALAQTQGIELWLRENVISRLPGGLAGDDDDRGPVATHRRRHPGFEPDPGARPIGHLLGAEVRDSEDTSLGRVIELTATTDDDGTEALGRLRLDALICSTSRIGGELGYTLTPEGPWVVRRLVQALHRGDRLVHVDDLDLHAFLAAEKPEEGRATTRLTVRRSAEVTHPYDR